jgi:3-isopropylmalate/(R)-2-methylmalate dehydratase small subunit
MSVTKATHRVWRLGADIDTDALAPGHAMKHGIDIIASTAWRPCAPSSPRACSPAT